MIKPIEVDRNAEGCWTHPEIPNFGENVAPHVLNAWALANNFSLTILEIYDDPDVSEDYVEELSDLNKPYKGFSKWFPKLPTENSFFLSFHESEDGPVAWIATPLTDI
ncbi:hypothetical protein [Vibrio sp. D431a]|uniref:hypothetical protein n=1 Tax=Vibrio sp. D431a TaxID=2837388 RepID=UPI00255391E8|nr:hypothetical protein [Vibrio sp. D431a]MDK9790007.1 hypothetical protein [Vibrio sp. D431a]